MRQAAYYVVKAMERAAAGTGAAGAGRVPPRRADGRDAPEAAGPLDGSPSTWQRVAAAVRHRIGGAPGRAGQGRQALGRHRLGRHRLGRPARAD
jgi:hypothetical protein